MKTVAPHTALARAALRTQLLAQREAATAAPNGAGTPATAAANAALAAHLCAVLRELEPQLLGLYWPQRGEFNAVAALHDDAELSILPWGLPFARRAPNAMHYCRWDGLAPTLVDACGIPSCDGAVVVPDVVLVPCVGFTTDGHRLGYGGGYFDRWLAQHPDVTSVGVAWANSEIASAEFAAQPHDQALTLIVTPRGVV